MISIERWTQQMLDRLVGDYYEKLTERINTTLPIRVHDREELYCVIAATVCMVSGAELRIGHLGDPHMAEGHR